MRSRPWEVVGTVGWRGAQTNALVNRGELIPTGFIPLRERAMQSSALSHLQSTLKNGNTMQGSRAFSCTPPPPRLQSDTLVSTSGTRRGVLEIICSCDIKTKTKQNKTHLLTKLVKRTLDYQLTISPPPKAETAQLRQRNWHPICHIQDSESQWKHELYHFENGTSGNLYTQRKSQNFCSLWVYMFS